jgi:hypothetical protein
MSIHGIELWSCFNKARGPVFCRGPHEEQLCMELSHADSFEELLPVFRVANFAKNIYLRIFATWRVEAETISTLSRIVGF